MKYDKYLEGDRRILDKKVIYDEELKKNHEDLLKSLKDESDNLIGVNINEG